MSMSWFGRCCTFNLLEVFNYYLIIAFAVSTVIRLGNYRAILGVIFRFSHRWPKLLGLAKQHRVVFLRWPTLLPIGVTLALMLGNSIAFYFVWSQARVTVGDLWFHWLALLSAMISGGLMVFLDCRAIFRFGVFDRAALEKDLDKAEYWLQSWKGPALRFVTFGLINPRKIVNDQVLDGLVKASLIVNGQMWTWALQIVLRLTFGLVLWMTWTVSLS